MFIFSLIHLNEAIVNKPNRSGGFSAVTWGILRAVDIKADSGRMLGLLGGEPAPAQPPFGGEESETQGSPGSRRLDGEIWLLSSLFFVSHCDLPAPTPPLPLCIWDILCRFLSLKMSSQCQPKAFPGATLPDFVGRRM